MKSVQIRSFFWSVFSCVQTEYGDLLRNSPCSVRTYENTDQKNSLFGHFSHSVQSVKLVSICPNRIMNKPQQCPWMLLNSFYFRSYVMQCAIWYHVNNLKNVTNNHGGVLLLTTIFHGCFSRFLNCLKRLIYLPIFLQINLNYLMFERLLGSLRWFYSYIHIEIGTVFFFKNIAFQICVVIVVFETIGIIPREIKSKINTIYTLTIKTNLYL